MPNVNLEGIRFTAAHPRQISYDVYDWLMSVENEALEATVPELTAAEREYATHAGNVALYRALRVDPDLLVRSGRMNPDQEYHRPLIAIAWVGEEPMGYAYGANNVSGRTPRERWRKRVTVLHNYRWLRMVAVHPEIHGRGVAHRLAQLVFGEAKLFQPASTYTWPQLMPEVDHLVRSWHMEPTNQNDPQTVYPFGEPEQSRAVQQVRYQHRSARQVAATIGEILKPVS